jgi:hypothetical protein
MRASSDLDPQAKNQKKIRAPDPVSSASAGTTTAAAAAAAAAAENIGPLVLLWRLAIGHGERLQRCVL